MVAMDAIAERGAAILHVGFEVQQQVPLSDAGIEKAWWGPLSEGV